MSELTPFEVHVDDDVLADLRARLLNTRWPGGIDGAGWDYGAPQDEVRRLCEAWVEFDWRRAEARLNEHPQFLTEIDGEKVHVLHVRSEHRGAVPLLVTHGWPGSVSEFLDVIGPLVDPPAHGGSADDAFHVIAPRSPATASPDRPAPGACTYDESRRCGPSSWPASATSATSPRVVTGGR